MLINFCVVLTRWMCDMVSVRMVYLTILLNSYIFVFHFFIVVHLVNSQK